MAFSNETRPGAGTRTEVTCSKCGATTTVPFVPTPGRPVFCRDCFSTQGGASGGAARPHSGPARNRGFDARSPSPASAGGRVPFGAKPNQMPKKRMMAQGRKGHFMHDAKALLGRMEGGMDDQHVRAFLEGLFARGARTSTSAAVEFIEEKVKDETITSDQGRALADLVERYSFWR